MALPSCLAFADLYYPRVKAETARQLVGHGWSQSRIAGALNVSQAMVSKYSAKPADVDPVVERMSQQLMQHLDHDGQDDHWCQSVRPIAAEPEAVQDFLQAERMLLQTSPDVMPQIGVNMARLVGADVLAYPGRMIAAKGKWVRPVPPEMGAEGHLAKCLRELHQANPRMRAMANIRGDAALRAKLPSCVDLAEGAPFASAVGPGVETIHDAGGFGIEPCIYIAGEDATQVAQRILQLETP